MKSTLWKIYSTTDTFSDVIHLPLTPFFPQCRQFRYIALELCSATLEDFIQGKFKADISILSILHQATSGLHHLHQLDIGKADYTVLLVLSFKSP